MCRLIILLPILAFLFSLGGCNTIGGFGKDLEATGSAIKNTVSNEE